MSMEVIRALAEASSKYEGVFTEDGAGVHIVLRHKSGVSVSQNTPAIYLPVNERIRNQFIAHQIRQAILTLDDKLCVGGVIGDVVYVEAICR